MTPALAMLAFTFSGRLLSIQETKGAVKALPFVGSYQSWYSGSKPGVLLR